MKNLCTAIAALCFPLFAFCQDITGLWTGTMYNDSTQESTQYELFISKENGKYTGYSQTWYNENDKDFYGIKKIKVRIAKDGKVIIQDATMMENNFPVTPDKNVIQLNVLNLVNTANETILGGPFVTNRSRSYSEITGRISLKRTTATSASNLIRYLKKADRNADVTALK